MKKVAAVINWRDRKPHNEMNDHPNEKIAGL